MVPCCRSEAGVEFDAVQAREAVYGMPYDEWKRPSTARNSRAVSCARSAQNKLARPAPSVAFDAHIILEDDRHFLRLNLKYRIPWSADSKSWSSPQSGGQAGRWRNLDTEPEVTAGNPS